MADTPLIVQLTLPEVPPGAIGLRIVLDDVITDTDLDVPRGVFGDGLVDLALRARDARLRFAPPLAIDGHAYRRRQRDRAKRRRR